jgi:ABC-type Fe3+-hydroxamate transport system substrate-binding protein
VAVRDATGELPRVVSLVPSATETLVAWDVTPIAVTRFCERPDLVTVGGTKDPDVAAVIELAPDLVVMCEEENRREDATRLDGAGLAVHVVRIESIEDVGPELDRLAAAVGAAAPSATIGPPGNLGLRAFVPIWRRPWMTMNDATYGSSLLSRLGIDNVFGDAPERYPQTTLEDAAVREPDVVLAPSEPYPFSERFRAELEQVAPVELIDGQDLFWWGVRTPGALARLARRIGDRSG